METWLAVLLLTRCVNRCRLSPFHRPWLPMPSDVLPIQNSVFAFSSYAGSGFVSEGSYFTWST